MKHALQASERIAMRTALPTGVIPAQAGTQDTAHRGSALGGARCPERIPDATCAPMRIGAVGPRLRGDDGAP